MVNSKKEILEKIKKETDALVNEHLVEGKFSADDGAAYKVGYLAWEYIANFYSKKGWAIEEMLIPEEQTTILIKGKSVVLFEFMSEAVFTIVEKVGDCLKYYNSEKSDENSFINYFMKSFKKEYVIASMTYNEDSHGLVYRDADSYTDSEEKIKKAEKRELSDKKLLRNLNTYLRNHPEVSIDDIERLEIWRAKNDIGKTRLKQLIEDYRMHGHVIFLDEKRDGDLRSFDEIIEDKNARIENKIEMLDAGTLSNVLELINEIYLNCGNNTVTANKIRSVWATNKVSLGINETGMFERAEKLEFFDKEVYIQIIRQGRIFKKKEIAEICKSTAVNVTKITNSFWNIVEESVLKKNNNIEKE